MQFESFSSEIEVQGALKVHILPVPPEIAEGMPKRVILQLGTRRFRRGLQGTKCGDPFLVVGTSVLNQAGLKRGDHVEAQIAPDPTPDELDIAKELTEALRQDPNAQTRWDTFTFGKKRSLNHYVDSAKREETRARRATELAEKIATRTLHNDP